MYAKTIIFFLQILHPLELERIAEKQRVQDARLYAIDRSFDNLHQISVSMSNNPVQPHPFKTKYNNIKW